MPKNKICFFLIAFVLLIFLFTPLTKANSLPLLGKVIFIDPGHGGIC